MTTTTLTSTQLSSNNINQVFKSELLTQIFTFEKKSIIILGTREKLYFVGKQICDVLEYKNTSRTLDLHVENKWKIKYKDLTDKYPEILNNTPVVEFDFRSDTELIEEPGLYSLIFGSKLEKAKMFRDIVFEHVLPSIRKTGEFKINQLQEQLKIKDEQIEKEQIRSIKFETLYNQNTSKHHYPKFKNLGPCFYIIIQGLEYKDDISRIKIGICGCRKRKYQDCPHCNGILEENIQAESFDSRLKDHRTLWPQLQVKFAVYTEDAELLEKCMKRLYKKQINPNGHEIIQGVNVEDVIENCKKFLNSFNIFNPKPQYTIEENIEEYNKSIKTHMKTPLQIEENKEENAFISKIEEDVSKNIMDGQEIKEEIVAEITEKSKITIEEYKEFKEYLSNIKTYIGQNLTNLLLKFKLGNSGLKQNRVNRLEEYLKKKITEFETTSNIELNENFRIEIITENVCETKIISEQENNTEIKDENTYILEQKIEHVNLIPVDTDLSLMVLRQLCKQRKLKQVGTKSILIERINENIKNGTTTPHGSSKTVYKYDKNGTFIEDFKSTKEAALSLSKSIANEKVRRDRISDICLGKNGYTYLGYIWRYEKAEIDQEILDKIKSGSQGRPLIKTNLETLEIEKFHTLLEASEKLNINLDTLMDSLWKKKEYVRKGEFRIKYAQEKDKKLVESDFEEIKKMHKDEGISVKELAKKFNKSVKHMKCVLK